MIDPLLEDHASPGSAFYYALRGAKQNQRARWLAAECLRCAFNGIATSHDEQVRGKRLAWWQQAIAIAAVSANHPALDILISHADEPKQASATVMQSLMLLANREYLAEDFDQLWQHSGQLAGNLYALAGDGSEALKNVGALRQLCDLYQNARLYADSTLLPLPHSWPEEAGLPYIGTSNDPAASEALWQRLNQRLTEQTAQQPATDSRIAQRLWALDKGLLKALQGEGHRVLTHITRLTPLHMLWLTWRP